MMDFRRCSMSGGDLWIGLPPNPKYGRTSIEQLPQAPRSVLFVEGPVQGELIAEFAEGPWPDAVENLMIGTSHDYVNSGHPTPYDFTQAVAALCRAKLPALKRLILGDMELLFNGHGYYGRLGDITRVFEIAPQLEELRIYGSAEVSSPVRHDKLRTLLVTVDDIAGHCQPMNEASFTNLLVSQFRKLAQFQFSPEAEEAPPYHIPDVFYSGEGFPALEAVSIDGLAAEDAIKLATWKKTRGLRW